MLRDGGPSGKHFMRLLRAVCLGVIRLLRWIAFEFLPLRVGAGGFPGLATVCRLAGCGVALGILSVELRGSATSGAATLILFWTGSALTAVLIGNCAREWTFELCSRLVTLSGHTFCRTGVTLGGRAFLEVHYPRGTWLRCEFGAADSVYEWTDRNGRCKRLEIQPRLDSGRKFIHIVVDDPPHHSASEGGIAWVEAQPVPDGSPSTSARSSASAICAANVSRK
jgi:hypothetical protein